MSERRDRWQTVVTTWLAVYPLITLLLAALEPLLATWPLPLRTLVVSLVMVPVMVLWVAPAARTLWR